MSKPITYFNQVITSTTSNGVAEISKTYDSFIKKQSKNPVSVVVDKFKIDLSTVPLVQFNPTLNFYSLELQSGAITSGRFSLSTYFYSSSPNAPAIVDTSFYSIYTFDHFIQILNDTLAGAYAQFVINGFAVAGNASPFFTIDHTTHLVTLHVSHTFIEGAVNQATITFNEGLMYPFFDGMPLFVLNPSIVPLVNGRDARFDCRDWLNNQVTLPGAGGQLYYQQRSNAKADTVIKWNVCKGIVVTSGLLTQREGFPEGQGITTTGGTVNNSLASTDILMNFDLLYSDNSRPLIVTYTAPTYDKRVIIRDQHDINEIAFKFFWYDKFNKLYPLNIYGNDICSLRIAFIEE